MSDYVNESRALLPCGHFLWTWHGWKQDADAPNGLSIQVSLESHVMKKCFCCGAIVPLGPANDSPGDEATARAMRVEQRAAEYAMETRITSTWPAPRWGSKWPDDVIRGFFGLVHFEDEDMYLAGWLAHAIAAHGES